MIPQFSLTPRLTDLFHLFQDLEVVVNKLEISLFWSFRLWYHILKLLSWVIGVCQGENLSPVLFSLFLNDLVEFMSKAYNGLTTVYNVAHNVLDTDEISVYLRL